MKLVRFASVGFAGLFAGFLLTVLVLEQSLRRFDAQIYTQVRQVELVRLDGLASVTLLPAIIATAVLVLRARRAPGTAVLVRRAGRAPAIAALVLLAGVFVLTLVVNQPINSDQADWVVANPPADWADIRDRWQLAHLVRTVAAIGAFGLLIGVRGRAPE
jgi:uncharacterized membrane protein